MRKSSTTRWPSIAVTLTLSLISIAWLGCSSDKKATQTTAEGGSKKLRFAVIPKGTSHQFWKSVHAGAEAAAKELGEIEIIWKGPETEADTAGQIAVVKNFITNRVDGIVLAPNHSEALVDVVAEANAENIPVAVFDSGLGKGPSIVSYIATDNYKGGQLAAQTLAAAMNQQGSVILLRYKEGSESTEQRENGFLDELAKIPAIKILSSDQYAGTTTEEAMSSATNLLNKYRDEVTGIFAVCEPNCNGTLEALHQTGLSGKVKFVAFDSSESLIKGLEEKTVAGIVLQDPFAMGRESVKALAKSIKGEKVDAVIGTGEYVATPENQSTEPYNGLLRPEMTAH